MEPTLEQRILGCPTVADDLALLANSTSDLQLMLDVTNSFANREKYVIHPDKSTIIMRIPKKSIRFEVTDWKLGNKEVSISQTTTHLGILVQPGMTLHPTLKTESLV